MQLELWAFCDGRQWRNAHLVRCFNYPTTIGTAMIVPGNEATNTNTSITTTTSTTRPPPRPPHPIHPTTTTTTTTTTTIEGSIPFRFKWVPARHLAGKTNAMNHVDDVATTTTNYYCH